MNIGGFIKTSLSDFPGHISAIIFTAGCNLRCPYCHNPDLITTPDKNAANLKEIFDFLASRKDQLTGVVITGGEPLMHADILELIEGIHHLGFAVKIDTNGTYPRMLEAVINSGWCSYIAMDVKSSPKGYARATGTNVSLDLIRESISLLKTSGLPLEFRTTVVPGLHTAETISGIGSLIGIAPRYALQNFSGRRTLNSSLSGITPFSKEEIAALAKIARPFCRHLIIR